MLAIQMAESANATSCHIFFTTHAWPSNGIASGHRCHRQIQSAQSQSGNDTMGISSRTP